MTINLRTARLNIIEFFESYNDIFITDVNGNLGSISRFNLLGRFVEWIKDFRSGWKKSENTDKIFKETLEIIQSSLEIDPKNNYYFTICCTPKIFLTQYAVDYSHRTMSDLADRIMTSSFAGKPGIMEITTKIKSKTLDIIKTLSKEEKDKFFDVSLLF